MLPLWPGRMAKVGPNRSAPSSNTSEASAPPLPDLVRLQASVASSFLGCTGMKPTAFGHYASGDPRAMDERREDSSQPWTPESDSYVLTAQRHARTVA